jgi:hypothetical protein
MTGGKNSELYYFDLSPKITRAGLYHRVFFTWCDRRVEQLDILFFPVPGEYKGWPLLNRFLYLA